MIYRQLANHLNSEAQGDIRKAKVLHETLGPRFWALPLRASRGSPREIPRNLGPDYEYSLAQSCIISFPLRASLVLSLPVPVLKCRLVLAPKLRKNDFGRFITVVPMNIILSSKAFVTYILPASIKSATNQDRLRATQGKVPTSRRCSDKKY